MESLRIQQLSRRCHRCHRFEGGRDLRSHIHSILCCSTAFVLFDHYARLPYTLLCTFSAALSEFGSKGQLVSSITASQGLLFMLPGMNAIAQSRQSCVMHVAAGPSLGHSKAIFGDQSNIMQVRSSGFSILSSHSVQECHDLALVVHIASSYLKTPFVHFFDGLRTSHETNQAGDSI